MITISQPYIYRNEENGNMRLEAKIYDEKRDNEHRIWYEVSEEYGQYLCTELADAFLLALLPIAAKSEQDICIHANVSPELFYNAVHTHIPFYAAFLGKKPIQLTADNTNAVQFSGTAVATGCSLGVDSLSTIYQQMSPDCLPEYRLTHLTIFNSSQLGDVDQAALDSAFAEACRKSAAFTEEIGLQFVPVNSNITCLMIDSGLSGTQLFHYFTLSCVLAVQKLFKIYFLSSSYNSEHICVDPADLSHTEALIVPQMGNRNTKVILSDVFTKRTEKTEFISKNKLTPKYIDVCWSTQVFNMHGGRKYYAEGKTHRNCGWCDKCMRTLFTFELLGCLSDYEDAFDLSKYRFHRKDFIIKVVANSKYSIFYNEIYQLMKSKNFKIPVIAYVVRFFNVKDSKLVLWLWQTYNNIKRKMH